MFSWLINWKKCVVLRGMLQSPRLKDNMNNIGIYQSLSNNALYEHKFIQKNNKWYKYAVKCDDQKYFKYILDSNMVSTPGGFTDNRPISPMKPTPVKKTSARKALCLFTKLLDVKNKTDANQVGADK